MNKLTQDEIHREVVNTLKDYVFCSPKNEIMPYHSLRKDLGIDSLDIVDIALELEEKFDTEKLYHMMTSNRPGCVTDITQSICTVLGVTYQKPPRPVATSRLFSFGKSKENQNQGRE